MKSQPKKQEKAHMSFELPEFTLSQSTSQVIYKRCQTALVVLAIGIIVNLALRIDFVLLNGSVGEVSVTEMLQQLLLIIASGSFAYLARKKTEVKHAALLISAFFGVMFIREMDFWFDKMVLGLSLPYWFLAVPFFMRLKMVNEPLTSLRLFLHLRT